MDSGFRHSLALMTKEDLDDNTPVEYVASMNEDRKLFSLVITCKIPMKDEEYGAALMAFAQDILEGSFSFDDNAEAISEQ